MHRRREEIRLTGSTGFPEAAEIEGQNAKPMRSEDKRLFLPTFLVELAAVGQHDTAVACAIDIRVDEAAVLSGKRDVVLSKSEAGDGNSSDC